MIRTTIGALVLSLVMLFMLPGAGVAADCQVQVNAVGIGIVVCGSQIVDQLPLPTVTISAPAQPAPTVTVRPPQATTTVRPPAQTVTANPRPAPTVTVTAPGATVTNTTTTDSSANSPPPSATPSVGPTQLPTLAPTVSVGQGPNDSDTIEGPPPIIKFRNVPVGVGFGLLTLLIAVACILGGMYAGYTLGFKDKERKETQFMRSLLDSVKKR